MPAPKLTVSRGRNIGGPGLPVHTCTECGKEGFWGPTWQWYGSIQDEEDGTIRVKTCSEECMAQARRKGRCP